MDNTDKDLITLGIEATELYLAHLFGEDETKKQIARELSDRGYGIVVSGPFWFLFMTQDLNENRVFGVLDYSHPLKQTHEFYFDGNRFTYTTKDIKETIYYGCLAVINNITGEEERHNGIILAEDYDCVEEVLGYLMNFPMCPKMYAPKKGGFVDVLRGYFKSY